MMAGAPTGLPATGETDKSGWQQSDYTDFLRTVGKGQIAEQVSLEFTRATVNVYSSHGGLRGAY